MKPQAAKRQLSEIKTESKICGRAGLLSFEQIARQQPSEVRNHTYETHTCQGVYMVQDYSTNERDTLAD